MNDFKTFFESADITDRAFQSLMHVKKVVEAPPINYVWNQSDVELKHLLTRKDKDQSLYSFIIATQILPASVVWSGKNLYMTLRQDAQGINRLCIEFPENALRWRVRQAKWVEHFQDVAGKPYTIKEIVSNIVDAITPRKMERVINLSELSSKEVMEPFAHIYEQFKSTRILYAMPDYTPATLIKLFREQGMDMHYLFPLAKFFKVPIEAGSITDKEMVDLF